MHFVVTLISQSIASARAIDQQSHFKVIAMEAHKRAEAMKVESEHLKEVLTKAEANLASKKERRKAEVLKAKKEMV